MQKTKQKKIVINKNNLHEFKEIAMRLLERDVRQLADGPISRDLFMFKALEYYLSAWAEDGANFTVEVK